MLFGFGRGKRNASNVVACSNMVESASSLMMISYKRHSPDPPLCRTAKIQNGSRLSGSSSLQRNHQPYAQTSGLLFRRMPDSKDHQAVMNNPIAWHFKEANARTSGWFSSSFNRIIPSAQSAYHVASEVRHETKNHVFMSLISQAPNTMSLTSQAPTSKTYPLHVTLAQFFSFIMLPSLRGQVADAQSQPKSFS